MKTIQAAIAAVIIALGPIKVEVRDNTERRGNVIGTVL